MSRRFRLTFVTLTMCLATSLAAAEPDADGFVSLFNGHDLSGWENVNCPPDTFTVRDGMIVTTGKPQGLLRTRQGFLDFILEIEWRHVDPKGNSGMFLFADALPAVGSPLTRGIEIQMLVGRETENYTSHGDVFAVFGAQFTPDRPHPAQWPRCLPSEKRAKGAGEWNHYRVTAIRGRVTLAVNGKEVSGGSGCRPNCGYVCLESEGTECHFRNIRVRELRRQGMAPEDECSQSGDNFKALYRGLTLDGWHCSKESDGPWQPDDWKLVHLARSQNESDEPANLWTDKSYQDVDLIVDWRLLEDDPRKAQAAILLRGDLHHPISLSPTDEPVEAKKWNRQEITLRGQHLTVRQNGDVIFDNVWDGPATAGPIGLADDTSGVEYANLFFQEPLKPIEPPTPRPLEKEQKSPNDESPGVP